MAQLLLMSIWPKKNHLTTHMIVWKTPPAPEADNASFKSYHLDTRVHSNCLFTTTTQVKDILPLQNRTWQAIKRSSWTYTDAHIGHVLCPLLAITATSAWYIQPGEKRKLTSLSQWMNNIVRKQDLNRQSARYRKAAAPLCTPKKTVSPRFLSLRDKPAEKALWADLKE